MGPIWIRPGSFSVLTLTNMISFIKGLACLSFSQMIKVLQIPRNSFLFVFTAVFKKVLKNLGRYNDFKAQKRQTKSTVIPFNTSGTTGTRQKQTQECKNHCCSFKSVGTTGSLAETDSKQNEKTNTKQNGDARGNTPRNHPTPIQ